MWPEVLLGAGRDALDSINKPINRLGALPAGDLGEGWMPEGRRSCTLFTVEIILSIIREVQQSLSNVTRRKWSGGRTYRCLDQNPRRDQSHVTHLLEGRQTVGEKGWNYESYAPYREAFSFPLKAVDHFSCKNIHGLQMPSDYPHEYLSPLMREVQAGLLWQWRPGENGSHRMAGAQADSAKAGSKTQAGPGISASSLLPQLTSVSASLHWVVTQGAQGPRLSLSCPPVHSQCVLVHEGGSPPASHPGKSKEMRRSHAPTTWDVPTSLLLRLRLLESRAHGQTEM